MAAAPLIAAVAGIAGAGVQFIGQQRAASAQRKQERIRRRQADLEAARRRRQIIRESAIARAQTISQVGGQGIGFQGSSLAGATAGQSNTTAGNLLSLNQSQELGGQMFDAQGQESSGRSLAGIGSGIQSLSSSGFDAFKKLRSL